MASHQMCVPIVIERCSDLQWGEITEKIDEILGDFTRVVNNSAQLLRVMFTHQKEEALCMHAACLCEDLTRQLNKQLSRRNVIVASQISSSVMSQWIIPSQLGPRPFWFLASTEALAPSSTSTTATSPFSAAKCNGSSPRWAPGETSA